MKAYNPRPIDTSDVILDDDLKNLVELLAENTHDVWALERINDQWSYGPKRNDPLKQTPCLVHYSDLPESEKNVDRRMVTSLIKTILKKGYLIKQSATHKEIPQELKPQIMCAGDLSLKDILELWKSNRLADFKDDTDMLLALGKRSLKCEDPLLAYDIFSKGVTVFQSILSERPLNKHERYSFLSMKQQMALALAQCGALYQALDLLNALCDEGLDTGETAGILGRVYKDLYTIEQNHQKKREFAELSFATYHKAFIRALKDESFKDAYYTGINAAAIALFLGNTNKSRELAQNVKQLCLESIENTNDSNDYWLYATIGEASLLLKDINGSLSWYAKAVEKSGDDIRGRSSMRKQARLILGHLHINQTIDDCFQIPSVVILSGYEFKRSEKEMNSFIQDQEVTVPNEISLKTDDINAGMVYSFPVNEYDIIFLEQIIERGSEIHIYLPFETETYIQEAFEHRSGNWGERLKKILNQASAVITLGDYNPKTKQNMFDFTAMYLLGMARFRARFLHTDLIQLVSWEGSGINSEKPLYHALHHVCLPFMFADIKGYSTFTEDQLIAFSTHFLSAIKGVFDNHGNSIFSIRSQGDSIFVVFKNLETAVEVARELTDLVNRTDWTDVGLPSNTQYRVSLDAGPCYSYTEPLTQTTEFCGRYVNRAARLEGATPPGHIFASESFVALSLATGLKNTHFEYAGHVTLPKNHGFIPAYYVT